MSKIILDDVNIKLLEEQRKILWSIDHSTLTKRQSQALDGIQNMLNAWSDEIYFGKEQNENSI